MYYLTQIIHLHPGQEAVFEEFEAIAIPLMSDYGGQLLLRIRPTPDTLIAGESELPYEIHLVHFPDEASFQAFAADPRRQELLPLKEAAIRKVLLIKGAI